MSSQSCPTKFPLTDTLRINQTDALQPISYSLTSAEEELVALIASLTVAQVIAEQNT